MLPCDGSRRPASEWQEPPVGARRLTHIEPRRKSGAVEFHRHQHTPVEAGSAGQEALEVVDGREAGLGIVEGQELAVHGAPAAARGAVLPGVGVYGACGELRGQTRLCGHVGERVGKPFDTP